MSRQRDDEVELDEFDDDEINDDSAAEELPCPSCGRTIYEDTDRCPHCGDWVMPLAAAAVRKDWVWWTALALVAVMFVTWGLAC